MEALVIFGVTFTVIFGAVIWYEVIPFFRRRRKVPPPPPKHVDAAASQEREWGVGPTESAAVYGTLDTSMSSSSDTGGAASSASDSSGGDSGGYDSGGGDYGGGGSSGGWS